MKHVSNIAYGAAQVCCAILCVLGFLMGRMDIFEMFLAFETILCLGMLGDYLVERRRRKEED